MSRRRWSGWSGWSRSHQLVNYLLRKGEETGGERREREMASTRFAYSSHLFNSTSQIRSNAIKSVSPQEKLEDGEQEIASQEEFINLNRLDIRLAILLNLYIYYLPTYLP